MKNRVLQLITLFLLIAVMLSGCQEYRAYEWEEDYSSSNNDEYHSSDSEAQLFDYDEIHEDNITPVYVNDFSAFWCCDVELEIDNIEVVPKGATNNPEDCDVLLVHYTAKNVFAYPLESPRQTLLDHFSPNDFDYATEYNAENGLDIPRKIDSFEEFSSAFGYRIEEPQNTITLYFMGGYPKEIYESKEFELNTNSNLDGNHSQEALIDEIKLNEILAGTDRDDVTVVFADDAKSCIVALQYDNIGDVANSPELSSVWDNFCSRILENNQKLMKLLNDNDMSDWSSTHVVIGSEETVYLIIENGKILFP